MSGNSSANGNNGTMVRDLTQGNVVKQLLLFAAPLFVSNALQAIYNIVDMIVVGQVIGGAGMSAVSIGGNVLHILTFLAMGFSSAGQIIIAQLVGAGNREGVRKTIGTLFTVLLSLSLVVAVICYCIRGQILRLINTPEEAYTYTMDYTVICITGLFFIYGYNIVSAILRGMGDSRRPFLFVAIAAVLNTILDIIFVAFLGMEVRGAALATVIGQGFSFIFALVYLYRHRDSFDFDFKPASFLPDRKAAVRIAALGIPMAIQSAAVSISQTVVTAWVNTFGVTVSAVTGIYSKVNMMVGMMSGAVTTAAASMIGQNLGAKTYKRVPQILRTAAACTLVLSVILTGLVLTFPDLIFELFTSDRAVIAAAAVVIGPILLNFYGSVSRTVGFAIINGSGNSRLNLAVAILDGMIARISIAYFLGFSAGMGPQGFWYGDAIAGFVPFLIGFVYYLTGNWKKSRL